VEVITEPSTPNATNLSDPYTTQLQRPCGISDSLVHVNPFDDVITTPADEGDAVACPTATNNVNSGLQHTLFHTFKLAVRVVQLTPLGDVIIRLGPDGATATNNVNSGAQQILDHNAFEPAVLDTHVIPFADVETCVDPLVPIEQNRVNSGAHTTSVYVESVAVRVTQVFASVEYNILLVTGIPTDPRPTHT